MKKRAYIKAILMAVAFVLTVMYTSFASHAETAATASGECGEDITWELDGNGTLTLQGSGKMWDFRNDSEIFDYHPCPWEELKSDIKKVVIGEGITMIGASAFEKCENLGSVSFPESLTSIGPFSFLRCSSLQSIALPSGIMELGQEAFSLTGIKSATIPGSVVILDDAFYRCLKLESVYFESSRNLYKYYSSLFANCPLLQKIEVSEDHDVFKSVDGVLYTKDGKELISYPSGRKASSYRVLDGTESVWQGAFSNMDGCNPNLKKLTFPKSIVKIGSIFQARMFDEVRFEGDAPEFSHGSIEEIPYGNIPVVSYPRNNASWETYLETHPSQRITWRTIGAPVISTQPKDQTGIEGDTVQFSVQVSDVDLKYKWQVSDDKGKTWKNFGSGDASATTDTLKLRVTGNMNGYSYRCEITNEDGKTISKTVVLKVLKKPSITTQPVSLAVKAGGTAKFTVKAVDYKTCKWQVSIDSGKTWKNVSASNESSATKTLKVKAAKKMNGYRYRCVLNNGGATTISKSVKLKVVSKPVISTQPVSKSVKKGKNAVFKIKATGYDSCRWQVSVDGGKTWKNVSAGNKTSTTKSLSVKTAKKMNGYRYRCVLKNLAGKTVSKSVKLKVK